MDKNWTIVTGEGFDDFIQGQLNTGSFSLANEVILDTLIDALEEGEKSGSIEFDREMNLAKLTEDI